MKTIVSITPLAITADSRTLKIAASFARWGYRSIVVEGQPSRTDPADYPFEVRTVDSVAPLPIPGIRALWRYTSEYGTRVARVLPPASLYYLHGPYQFLGVYSAARRERIPIIYDAHDFYPQADHTPLLGRVESWCIRNATSVVTVSSGVAKLLSDRYGCRPVVIRNAHDSRLDKSPPKGLRELLGVGSDVFLLLILGNAKSEQHVDGAMDALSRLPSSVHLVFIGKNANQYTRDLPEGLQNRVHALPPVSPDIVVPLVHSADAALILYAPVSLNNEYCLPNRLFQTVAASLPLLYPRLTEIRAIAEHFGLGISIDPFSSESIRAAVSDLLTHPDHLTQYKAAARVAAAELSWEKEENILKDLLLKIPAFSEDRN